MRNGGYFRMPAVWGDTVVFVTEDDLWSVPLAGGTATRLTASAGAIVRPSFSPDGERIAFTGRDEHDHEVWVMPAAGGPAKRRTFLGAASMVTGWTPDGRIVFRTDHGPHRAFELWSVDPDRGQPERLGLGPMSGDISYGPKGRAVMGRNTIDPARWKRYRGGRAGVMWVDRGGKGRFEPLLHDLGGNVGWPLWAGARIYFVSDHEGIGNLYSCTPAGADVRRHTDHGEFYAGFAQTDGRTIVYQHAAEIWALDIESDRTRRVDVDLPSPRAQRNRRFVRGDASMESYAVHPEGHSLALIVRGRAVTMGLWEGAVRQPGEDEGARYRLARWMPGGERVVCVSDSGGEEHLEVLSASGAERVRADIGRPHEIAVNPVSGTVAVVNHRLELIVVDPATGKRSVVDRSKHARITGPAWSPDGRWLAYSFPESHHTRSIKIADARARKTHRVTRPDFGDFGPAFDEEGRYLYLLSYRVFDPVSDVYYFDLGFPRGAKPYAVVLRASDPSPFEPAPRGFRDEEAKAKKAKEKKEGAPPPEVVIDFAGIEDRIVAFPVPEARYGRIRGIEGKVLFTSFPVEGNLGSSWDDVAETFGSLEVFDLDEQKHSVLASGVADFEVAGGTMVYRAGKRLRAVKAGVKPDPETQHDPPSRRSGWVDLGRVRVSIDPPTEWAQMYDEAWRLMRQNFWTPDLSEVDWKKVRRRYRPLLDKVGARTEFSDLMWEMQGELGTSHAYEYGGDHRTPPPYAMGHLGADVEWDARARGWRVTHVVRGDPWVPGAGGPLVAPGVDVREGDVIVAVNGKAVDAETPPQAHLVHQAGQRVELTIGGGKRRSVVVKALASETPARYREWVEANRERVHAATKGLAGYVHIPDMGAAGFAEFHRTYMAELSRPALLVDVRYNAGGNVSQLLLEKLARKRIAWDIPRWGEPFPYPSDSFAGPIVAITNEWAGSDGDIFTHAFKMMGIGTVIGKRTWGGVIGIWVRHQLVDGSATTQPEFSNWFTDVGYGVENYGTDPDVEVDIAPQDHKAGKDPQMDAAIKLLNEGVRTPPRVPDFGARPSLALPVLPPRPGEKRGSSRSRRTRRS